MSDLKNDIAVIDHELWCQGEPLHIFHDGQLELLKVTQEINSFLAVVNCGRQFGKTFWACTLAVMHCLKRESNVVKYGSAHYTDLSKFIYPALRKIKELMPVHLQFDIIESKKQCQFKNGSVIDLCGLDVQPDGLRGNSVSLVIIEEAGYVAKLHYVYFDVVIPMFTHTQHLNPKCVMIGTPSDDLTHDFTTFFIPKAQREGTYVHKTIDDNPLLKEEEKNRIKDEYTKDARTPAALAVQEAKRDRELYGLVRGDPFRAIIPEWEDTYIQEVEHDEYFPYYFKYTGCDLGVVDKTIFLFFYYDFKNACAVFEGEFQDSGLSMTTDILAKNVKENEERLYQGKIHRRSGDNNNPLLFNDFTIKHGLPITPVKKEMLHVMVNNARQWVRDGRIRIHPSLHELAGCLKHGRWNEKKTEFEDSKLFGHFDALAAFIYSLRIIDTQTNPIPVTHGLTGEILVVRDRKTQFEQKMRATFNKMR